MVETSNQFSHLAWVDADIPRDRPGTYLVWLDRPSLGSRIGTCRVAKTMNSYLVTINNHFEFDCGNLKILKHVPTEGLEPMEG